MLLIVLNHASYIYRVLCDLTAEDCVSAGAPSGPMEGFKDN
jgi:hypothetical protein